MADPTPARRVLHTFRLDEDRWQAVAASAPVQAFLAAAQARRPTAADLLADTWHALWKTMPTLRPAEALHPGWAPHHGIVSALLTDPDYQVLHAFTQLDDTLATAALLELGDRLVDQIPEPPPEASADAPPPIVDDPAAPPAAGEPSATTPDRRRAVRTAMAAATQETAALQQRLASWGIEPGQLQHLPLADRLTLLQQLRQHPDLVQLSAWLGRIRHAWRAHRAARVTPGAADRYSVTTGRDVRHALPQELALLARPATRRLVGARLVDGRLLQYALRGRERVRWGPIVVAVDTSGSTTGAVEVWEKAVAGALVLEGRRTQRPVRVTLFSGPHDPLITYVFPPQESPATVLTRLVACCQTHLGGGTDWVPPLTDALAALADPTWTAADLVFLTDGLCTLPEATVAAVQAAQRRGLRVFTILVGDTPPVETVQPWSTAVYTLSPRRLATDGLVHATRVLDAVTESPAA